MRILYNSLFAHPKFFFIVPSPARQLGYFNLLARPNLCTLKEACILELVLVLEFVLSLPLPSSLPISFLRALSLSSCATLLNTQFWPLQLFKQSAASGDLRIPSQEPSWVLPSWQV